MDCGRRGGADDNKRGWLGDGSMRQTYGRRDDSWRSGSFNTAQLLVMSKHGRGEGQCAVLCWLICYGGGCCYCWETYCEIEAVRRYSSATAPLSDKHGSAVDMYDAHILKYT